RRGGDDTAYLAGQVTLNPVPHVMREPFGTVLVPLLTYFTNGWMMGWASAPYDPRWEARHPHRAAAMSAAGPAANLLLALLAFAVLKTGLTAGVWAVPPDRVVADQMVVAAQGSAAVLDGVGRFLSIVLTLNVVLGVFNLIPLPPLDGISVLAGLVAPVRSLYQRARGAPVTMILGILVAWKISRWIVNPAWQLVVGALIGS
ncbi:MAG TPA: site-2 protease family protein, partial [Candidatus Polarisedimenticolaceae bacterium]|nr:site-2 protease family protein [Candidatus Polarisedimenticolaceae bacterium]